MFALHQQDDSARARARARRRRGGRGRGKNGLQNGAGCSGEGAVSMATAVWVKNPPCLHPSLEEVKPHHGGREVNLL